MNEITNAGWIGILLAPFIGSFAGSVILRLPAGLGFLGGRSRCDHCAQRLEARDLFPILSWLRSRGRCRHCGVRVGAFYPAVELAALAVAISAVSLLGDAELWLIAASLCLGWTLLILGWIDFRARLLPDLLVLPLAVLGLGVAALLPGEAWSDHLIGAAAGFGLFALTALVYRAWRGRDGLGWGDAKLMGAAGAWVSWQGLPSVLVIGCGGLLLVLLIGRLAGRRLRRDEELPLGTALCFAIWAVWLLGPLELG